MYFDETLPSSREAEHTSDTLHATLTKEFAEDTYNKAKHGGGGKASATYPGIEYETTSSSYMSTCTYLEAPT